MRLWISARRSRRYVSLLEAAQQIERVWSGPSVKLSQSLRTRQLRFHNPFQVLITKNASPFQKGISPLLRLRFPEMQLAGLASPLKFGRSSRRCCWMEPSPLI